jgi:hypothetical protein
MVEMYMPRHMMTLSKAEQNIVKYHRDTIRSGKVGRDEEGRPVTVYSTGIMIPEGPNKGQYVSVPGYIRDKGRIVYDEDELYNIWKNDIKSGKFPIYKTPDELNKRSQEIHTIMDQEEKDANKSMVDARLKNRGLLMNRGIG